MTGPSTISPQDEDWQRFRSIHSIVNHWRRPGWNRRRQAYYWYLTFDSPELRVMAEYCQRHLRVPYLDPVPSSDLHLTLPKVGWSDQLSHDEADAVATAAL